MTTYSQVIRREAMKIRVKREAAHIRRQLPPPVQLAFAFAKVIEKRGAKTRPEEALLVLANAYAQELVKHVKAEDREYTLKDFI